jgi:hypothetical protein
MLQLPSDADVHGAIIDGLRLRLKTIKEANFVRVQDVMPPDTPDPQVLEWVAQENRVLITHDRGTMIGFVKERLAAEKSVAGLIVTNRKPSIADAIADILLVAQCLSAEEVRDRVFIYLPFRQ